MTDVDRSCSWWLLAQPEAGKIGKLSWNLASGFLTLRFCALPQKPQQREGREAEGWVFVSFKPQGFYPQSFCKQSSCCPCKEEPYSLPYIYTLYIERYLINILYENKYFFCVLRTIVTLIYSPAIMLCLFFVLDNPVPIAFFLIYRHHLPAPWGSRKPPRRLGWTLCQLLFYMLTAWVWLVLVKFMRKMLPFTAPVSW